MKLKNCVPLKDCSNMSQLYDFGFLLCIVSNWNKMICSTSLVVVVILCFGSSKSVGIFRFLLFIEAKENEYSGVTVMCTFVHIQINF